LAMAGSIPPARAGATKNAAQAMEPKAIHFDSVLARAGIKSSSGRIGVVGSRVMGKREYPDGSADWGQRRALRSALSNRRPNRRPSCEGSVGKERLPPRVEWPGRARWPAA